MGVWGVIWGYMGHMGDIEVSGGYRRCLEGYRGVWRGVWGIWGRTGVYRWYGVHKGMWGVQGGIGGGGGGEEYRGMGGYSGTWRV